MKVKDEIFERDFNNSARRTEIVNNLLRMKNTKLIIRAVEKTNPIIPYEYKLGERWIRLRKDRVINYDGVIYDLETNKNICEIEIKTSKIKRWKVPGKKRDLGPHKNKFQLLFCVNEEKEEVLRIVGGYLNKNVSIEPYIAQENDKLLQRSSVTADEMVMFDFSNAELIYDNKKLNYTQNSNLLSKNILRDRLLQVINGGKHNE